MSESDTVRSDPAPATGAVRRLLTGVGVVGACVALALVGTGSTYALWNGVATQSGDAAQSSIVSGTTALTVNGASEHTVNPISTTRLAPGRSVVTANPVVLANTGTTPIEVDVARVDIAGSTALANELLLGVAQSSTCAAGLAGTEGRLAGFTFADRPIELAPGASAHLCVEVSLDLDAPVTVKNATTTFRLTLVGTQVRRP